MSITKYGWLLAGTILVASAAGVSAHGGATGIVKERMDAMDAMGDAVIALSDMFRAGAYDPAIVTESGTVIARHSGEALVSKFPEGSDGAPSEAKPEIWSDWQTFVDLADNLSVLAEAMVENAGNPEGNMPGGGMMGSGMGGGMMGSGMGMPDAEMLAQMPVEAIFEMTVQTCASCHGKFRVED